MRYGMLDLLFLVACLMAGTSLFPWVITQLKFLQIPGLQVWGILLWPLTGCGVWLLLVDPVYRWLRLPLMMMPRCPCCGKFQSGYFIREQAFPRIEFECPGCRGRFVIWHNGQAGNLETWQTPVLELRWPYPLGRCRLASPAGVPDSSGVKGSNGVSGRAIDRGVNESPDVIPMQ